VGKTEEDRTLGPEAPAPQDGELLTQRPVIRPTSVSPELIDFLAPPQAPEELGRLGPYRVLEVLGAGGMGVVYLAEDPNLKRTVALKALLPTLAVSTSARQRFLREAQAAAAIDHTHIVTILQVGEDRGIPFIAMQFLKGETLEDRLKRQNQLPATEALRIGRETAEGLAAAHERELIHRDIKPANLWLEGERGRVKILDFGLARAGGQDSQLTQQGTIVGTPAYMSPEQGSGKTLDGRSDLFSLGCVLYRISTGRVPFKGSDSISTLMAVATEQPRPPSQVNPEVPTSLSNLIMRLLAKKPDDRPGTALEVVAALEAIERNPNAEAKAPPPVAIPIGVPPTALRVEPPPVRVVTSRPARVRDRDPESEERGRIQKKSILSLLPLWAWAIVCTLGLVTLGIFVAAFLMMSAQPGMGRVVLTIDQVGTEVYLDGRLVTIYNGDPFTLVAEAGQHELRVTKSGFETYNLPITVKAGASEPMQVWMRREHDFAGRPPDPNERPGQRDPPVKIPGLPDQPAVKPIASLNPVRRLTRGGVLRNWLAFSPDGKHFATNREEDFSLNFWDADRGDIVRDFDGKGGGNGPVIFSADGKHVAAYNSETLRVWDVESGRVKGEVKPLPGNQLDGLQFTDDGKLLFTACWNVQDKWIISVGDLENPKKEVSRLIGHTNVVTRVLLARDGQRAVSTSEDGTTRLWDVKSGKELLRFAAPAKVAKCMSLSPDGRHLLASHQEDRMRLFDLETGNQVKLFVPTDQLGSIETVAFTSDGRYGLAGSMSGIRVWDLESGKQVQHLNCEGTIINSLCVSPDDKTVVAGGFGGNLFWFKLGKEK
jgi:serine/threonine protein kinase